MTERFPRTAEIVIIGGGIVGASIAYHLTQAGCNDVVMLERECVQGLGSTGRATGGIRAQFSHPIDIAMSLYSLDFIRNFKEETGVDPCYRSNGYIFLATTQSQMSELKSLVALQQSSGLKEVRIVSREDIKELAPILNVEDVLGGTFCSIDGFIEPLYLLKGFTEQAIERGAKVLLNTSATGIQLTESRIRGVETNQGRISTNTVVNAAGAWAKVIAAMAGVELPVEPLRRHVAGTQPFPDLPDETPMIIGLETGFHFRKDHHGGGGVMLLWNGQEEEYGENLHFDYDWLKKTLEFAKHRVPHFKKLQVTPRRCWSGLYEMTPDAHPILGKVSGVEGLYLANGFSGHGVMHSPATGKLLSELIIDGRAKLMDISSLSFDRFASGKLFAEQGVL
jgi:sarcosine oxidase subunit beta